MDGVVRALPACVLALWVLYAQQGARIGPFALPEISYAWALAGLVAVAVLLRRPAPSSPTRRDGIVAWALVCTAIPVHLVRAQSVSPLLSLPATVNGAPTRIDSLQFARRRDLRRATGLRRNVEIELDAVLELPRAGDYRFDFECDDSCELALGQELFRVRGSDSLNVLLESGEESVHIRYQQLAGPAVFRLGWDTPSFFEPFGFDFYVREPGRDPSLRLQRHLAHLTLAITALWWFLLSIFILRWSDRARRVRASLAPRSWVPRTACVLWIAYGCFLRFDALLVHSGLARDGAAAAGLHRTISHWTPRFALFNPMRATDDPYRADVRSYLDRAESMSVTTFYAPSFREPFYVAIVATFVRIVGSEFGVLLQSFVLSCATLALFAWLCARKFGWYWSCALLVPVALHEWLVLEAPTGYRMSAYGFFLLAFMGVVWFSTGAPGRGRGVVVGALAGLLCLIRLSALSVVAPVVAMVSHRSNTGVRLPFLAIATLVASALVLPFLFSNLVAHGDPLYSVSFHTEFWLRAEGLDRGQGSVSVLRYLTSFGRLGEVVTGTFLGLTALPLMTFVRGLAHFPPLGWAVIATGALGLAVDVRKGTGGLLPAAYLGQLLPFAYIQNFPSGEMPRFVMPAYFLLVLAVPCGAGVLLTLFRRVANVVRRPSSG